MSDVVDQAVLVVVLCLLGAVASWWVVRTVERESGPLGGRGARSALGLAVVILGLATLWWHGSVTALPASLMLVWLGVALVVIDVRTRRLPNALVLPAYPIALLLLALASWTPELGWDAAAFARALLGGLVLGGVYLAMHLAQPAGLGMGDVKLAVLLGAYLGWQSWTALALGGCGAFLVAGAQAVVLLLARRMDRKGTLAMGPAMIVAAVAVVMSPA